MQYIPLALCVLSTALVSCRPETSCGRFELHEELDRCVCPGTTIPPDDDGGCPEDGPDASSDAGTDAMEDTDVTDSSTDVADVSVDTPADVPPPPCDPASTLCGVLQICTTNNTTCAIVRDGGRVLCWGSDLRGLLNGRGDSNVPISLQKESGDELTASLLACGANHVCAVEDSTTYCWGFGARGQTGNGGVDADNPTPTPVVNAPLNFPIGLWAGQDESCALMNDGRMWCWGDNTLAQFGAGPTTEIHTAMVEAPEYDDVELFSLGRGKFSCGVRGGELGCSGNNFNGQLGDGSNENSTMVVDVGLEPTRISTGSLFTCGIAGPSNDVLCWGDNRAGQLGTPPPIGRNRPATVDVPSGALAIDSGRAHSCALYPDEIHCWGDNESGQLGDETTFVRTEPVRATTIDAREVVGLSLGSSHSCALMRNESVACWGAGDLGQLGYGRSLDSPTAQYVVPELVE